MQLIKYYKKFLFLFFILIIFYSLKNLGYFFDITQEPIKSDVILCLGGDNGERINKVIQLYENNYSIKNKIIITEKYKISIERKIDILIKHNVKEEDIVFNSKTLNTYQELLYIKGYMLKNNYKSLIIVAAEPHSRRIKFLIDKFFNFSDANITYTIVGEDAIWWNKKAYYYNKKAIFFIIKESFKIFYNYAFYSLDLIFQFDKEAVSKLIKLKNIFL